ncbi:MAG TPA: AraC family transcriptional regulator [Ruminococcus sp.]|nr:AraC family transcriptional regulator [Ruminococcus sp.]
MNRNDDYSENVNYTSKGLPILTSDEHLSELATYRELMHWHPDYEFLLVKDGVLDFDVNGEILHIKPNQGLFVNSERMHFGYSEKKKEVLFELVIISPDMIRNAFNSDVLDQLNSPENADYLIFHSNMLIWSLLKRIFLVEQKHEKDYQLVLQSEICLLVKELLSLCTKSRGQQSKELSLVKKMIHFIQEHYVDKISVADIAASAMINRNQCFQLFQETMRVSPQQYLEQYRINMSIELMSQKDNFADIAQACGFCSQSYYTKVFKEYYRMTPLQFKKKQEEKNHG